MDAAIGARIGIVAGLLMAATLSVTLGVAGLINRFALRSMSGFDSEMVAKLHAQIDLMTAQAAQTTPIPPWLIAIFLSPEFRAAIGLTSLAMLGVLLLAVSTLGGAFAGLLRARPRIAG
jgi:hypothetical protein